MEITRYTYSAGQQELVGQEFEEERLQVLLQAVELNTVVVVNVGILLLCDGKELVVVQPARITDSFSQLKLAAQLALTPVHRRNMALPSGQQQIASVASIIRAVRSSLRQSQLEAFLRRLQSDAVLDLILSDLVSPLELSFGLQKSSLMLEKNLCILGLQNRILVSVFLLLEGSADLFVASAFDRVCFATPVCLLGLSESLFRSAVFGRDNSLFRG